MTLKQTDEFLGQTPDGWEFFHFLFGIEETLRLNDFQGFLKDNGLPEFRVSFPVSDAMAYLSSPRARMVPNNRDCGSQALQQLSP